MASARFGKAKDRAFTKRKNNKGEVMISPAKLLSQLSKIDLFKLAEQTNIKKDAQKARKEITKRGLTFPEPENVLVV